MIEIQIHKNIFEDFPTFRRGIVIAKDIKNNDHSEKLEVLLKEVISNAVQEPIDIKTDFRTNAWNDAHRQFGSNPNKYPPAHCALLKRVQKKGAWIPFINKVVAIMNFNSIIDKIPVGGDDVNRAAGNLELCYADGSETFIPLGNPDTAEHPEPGEIIYMVKQNKDVMCRRWNWRNGHTTRITEETKAIVMNIDGLGKDSEERSIAARDRVAQMLEEFCQADVFTALLSPSRTFYKFEIHDLDYN
jgi:lysyl-tRNA synthetase class 2